MQRILLFSLFTLFCLFSNAQIVDQIKDASDANTASRYEDDDDEDDSDDYGYDDDSDEGGGGSSCNGCAVLVDGILSIFFSGDEAEEESYEDEYYVAPEDPFEDARIAKEDSLIWEEEVPEEMSKEKATSWTWYGELELRSAFGSGFLIALPEVRAGYWIFSTNLRYNTLVEPGVNFLSSYRTVDWQILQLQAITSRNFNMRFGFGLLNERYSGNTFPEMAFEVKGMFLNGRVGIPGEVRYSWDSETKNPVRGELGIGGEYRLLEFFHADLYASAGYLYQQYYGSVNLNAFQVGLRFVFY